MYNTAPTETTRTSCVISRVVITENWWTKEGEISVGAGQLRANNDNNHHYTRERMCNCSNRRIDRGIFFFSFCFQ